METKSESKSKSNPVPIIVGILVLVVLILAGLFWFSRGSTPAEQSQSPAVNNTSAPTTEAAANPTSTATGQATVAAIEDAPTQEAASSEVAAEAAPEIKAVTKVNLNAREGPSTSYPKVGNLEEQTEVVVIGKNEDGSWLLVKSGLGEVWVSNDPDLLEVDNTRLADVAAIKAPPLPYDAANPNVQEVLEKIPLVVLHEGSQTCASHGGLNHLLPEVANGNVIGPHSGDFVMGNDNVLFKVDNGSLVLIRENPVARFEGGKESLSFAEAMNLFARGDIVWTGSFGEWPARGVTGCDPAAKS